MAWHLWAEATNQGVKRYDPPRLIEGRLPTIVEYSGDGCWATLYENQKPVRTWMWMDPPNTPRKRASWRGPDKKALPK